MHLFIDEGGTFIPSTGWGVVCSLALPHKEVGSTRREVGRLTRDWPRRDGELKGGLLTVAHLESLVDALFRHDAIMHACAIDVAREDLSGVDTHKARQCEGITKYLAPTHHSNFVRQVWELRRVLERMPRQLYLQYVMLNELVESSSNDVLNYFAQRRPRELAKFEWTIDAKDPRRITTQEKWWRDVLAPLLESRARSEPMLLAQDSSFDYRFFDRSFSMQKEMWYPDRPRELVEGYDIKKMITERMAFVDSRSEILIQAVDILASFLRRLLAREIVNDEVARALGRLQIVQRRGGQVQSLQVLTVSRLPIGKTGLFKTLKTMTSAGRSMMKPSRRRAA